MTRMGFIRYAYAQVGRLPTPEVGMPRRNQREQHVPLDLTPPDTRRRSDPIPPRQWDAEDPHLRRLRQEKQAAIRQAEARKRNGIDWSVCLVPGCGESLDYFGLTLPVAENRNTDDYLPLCTNHSLVVWQRVQLIKNEPTVLVAAEDARAARARRDQERAAEEAARRRASQDGEIYFVRINDLVKVGWTRTLGRRLKEYGAGAELLAHYPAKAHEEHPLHKQLRPALAKGREWYRDGDLVQLFINHALERYGPPTAEAEWTEPKPDLVAQRRRR